MINRAVESMESKKKKYKDVDAKIKKDQVTCVICMADFENDDQIVELDCVGKHILHLDCMLQWLKSGQNKALKCPLCNQDAAKQGA